MMGGAIFEEWLKAKIYGLNLIFFSANGRYAMYNIVAKYLKFTCNKFACVNGENIVC